MDECPACGRPPLGDEVVAKDKMIDHLRSWLLYMRRQPNASAVHRWIDDALNGKSAFIDRDFSAPIDEENICGLCGDPGADKIAHPTYWPGERRPDGEMVHAECEQSECGRAHAALSDAERKSFLRSI